MGKPTTLTLTRKFDVVAAKDDSLVASFPTYLAAVMFLVREPEPGRSTLLVKTVEENSSPHP